MQEKKINTDKIPKNTRNPFRLEKVIKGRALGDIRNLFRPEKDKGTNDRALRDIRNFLDQKKTKALMVEH